MIHGDNIPTIDIPRLIKQHKGVVVKSDSPIGISFEDKTKSKNYFAYTTKTYFSPDIGEYSICEYALPSGEIIYTHQCMQGHSLCHRQKIKKVVELFHKYFSMGNYSKNDIIEIRAKKPSKPKISKKCKCKK